MGVALWFRVRQSKRPSPATLAVVRADRDVGGDGARTSPTARGRRSCVNSRALTANAVNEIGFDGLCSTTPRSFCGVLALTRPAASRRR